MDAATPVSKPALTNAAVAIKNGPGKIEGGDFLNPSNATVYVQIFDKKAADVTLGTDTPVLAIGIPTGQRAPFPTGKTGFNTGISAAATTGPANAVAPSAAVVANFNIR